MEHSVADSANFEEIKSPKLYFCLAMDAVGMLSYLVPASGELIDIVWAPLSALIFRNSFGGMTGKIGAVLNFIEEAAPLTDFIPSFTIGYFYVRHLNKKRKRQQLNV